MIKRMLLPSVFLGLCSRWRSRRMHKRHVLRFRDGVAIGAVPALPGLRRMVRTRVRTEVGASGVHGIADVPGGGRVRISCTNTNAAPVNPA
jgi:hypothetical protein